MARATQAQKAQRLNLARALLHRHSWPYAVGELTRRCSLSSRQAYRYLRQAQHLQQPVPVLAPTVAFTVKLPRPLVSRLRRFAAAQELTLSQAVRQALWAILDRGRRRV
jgi:hypothetical protein